MASALVRAFGSETAGWRPSVIRRTRARARPSQTQAFEPPRLMRRARPWTLASRRKRCPCTGGFARLIMAWVRRDTSPPCRRLVDRMKRITIDSHVDQRKLFPVNLDTYVRKRRIAGHRGDGSP